MLELTQFCCDCYRKSCWLQEDTSSVDYVSTSLLTKGTASRNCPEFPSHTRADRTIKNGSGTASRPNSVESPARVIQVEKSSFRAFHYDLDDPADALLCLIRGKKLWMTVHLGDIGGELERHCGDNDSERCFSDTVRLLRKMPPRQKKHIFYCVLDESTTLYLPYTWAHSVLTIVEDDFVCSMWYMELFTDEEEVARRRGNAANKCRTGIGRLEALGTA